MEKCFYFWKKDFGEFLSRLRSMGCVYAPVRVSDQSFAFRAVREEAEILCHKAKPQMDHIRDAVDDLEAIVDDQYWPLVKYRELLFVR